jgi:hypothetical protein
LLLKYKQEPCAIISGRLCNYSLDFKIIQIQGIAPFKLTPDGDYVRDYKEMALTAHEASAYFKTRSPAQVVSFNAPVRARQSKGLFENWQGFLIKELAQRLTYQTKLLMPTPEIHPACVLIGRGVMNDPHLTTAQIEKNYIQPFVALGGQLVGDYYELPLPIK